MITLFPALLALLPRRWTRVSTPGEPVIARAIWLEGVTGYRKSILAITAALTVLAAWGAVDVGFDYNMLKLQAKGVESVAWEERILTRAGRSGVTALATASSLDELRRKRDAFAALPSVSAGRERPDAGAGRPAGEGEGDRAARADRGAGARRAGAGARPRRAARAPRDPAAPPAARRRGGRRGGQARGTAGAGQGRGPARHAVPRRPAPGRAGARAAPGRRSPTTSATSSRRSRRT